MNSLKQTKELKNPGFIVFEGLDFSGKTYLAKRAVERLKWDFRFRLDVKYNHAFLRGGLIDGEHLISLSAENRVEYLLKGYRKDKLSENPEEFTEIFQDRYLPYLIFYAATKVGKPIGEMIERTKGLTKPKHIFLVECSLEERKRRAGIRNDLKESEREGLTKKGHERYTKMYKEIVSSMGVPYTVIDTTFLNGTRVLDYFLPELQKIGVLENEVSLESLMVDNDPGVFESTAKFKLEEVLKGKKHSPISIVRRIEGANYMELIRDGRHRAYASWLAGVKNIKAYVSYEKGKIEADKLKGFSDFRYKEGDKGLF